MAKERTGIPPLVKHERSYMEAVVRLMDDTVYTPMVRELVAYDPERYARKVRELRERIAGMDAVGQAEAQKALQDMETYQRTRFRKVLKSVNIQLIAFNEGAEPLIKQALEVALNENTGLIKNAMLDGASSLQDFVGEQIRTNPWDLGKQQKEIQGYLEGAGHEKAKQRARLITRDQNNKIIGKLNETRHRSIGGEEYRWRTSHDERVRDSHAHLDGQIFRWDSPPPEGHPGQAIQCRCVSAFVFRELSEQGKTTSSVKRKLSKGVL